MWTEREHIIEIELELKQNMFVVKAWKDANVSIINEFAQFDKWNSKYNKRVLTTVDRFCEAHKDTTIISSRIHDFSICVD